MACGSVRFFHAVGERAAEAARGQRQRADEGDRDQRQHERRRRARLAARVDATARAGRWRSRSPGRRASSTRTIATSAMPSSWPAAARSASGTLSVLSGSGRRPRRHERRRRGARGQHRDAAQAQRDDREPERAAAGQREQRAARVGEQQSDEQQPERGVGERVERRVARAPRAEPQHAGTAERGHQPDRVPVAERLAQARVDLVGVQRAREDLGQQRVAADDHAGRARRRPAAPPSAAGRAARARRPPTTWRGRRACGWPRARRRTARPPR